MAKSSASNGIWTVSNVLRPKKKDRKKQNYNNSERPIAHTKQTANIQTK